MLITLGIIGVVAAMTIPNLISNHQNRVAVTSLKKFYSTISQAYQYTLDEYGTPDAWYDGIADQVNPSYELSERMGERLTFMMKKLGDCEKSKNNKCFGEKYKKIDGRDSLPMNFLQVKSYNTADGMSFLVFSYGKNPRSHGTGEYEKCYGAISVDINGRSGPNVYGRDVFSFVMTETGIVPLGGRNQTSETKFPEGCNRTDCYGWCEGCAAWVLQHGNMDYLKYDNLSW